MPLVIKVSIKRLLLFLPTPYNTLHTHINWTRNPQNMLMPITIQTSCSPM